jgi:hypothetical protein
VPIPLPLICHLNLSTPGDPVGKGPTAADDWYRDVLAEGQHLGASGYYIALEEPRHVDVTENHAYVVVPATMRFIVQGKEIVQTGSVFTVALRHVGDDWRSTAWAWAKGFNTQ